MAARLRFTDSSGHVVADQIEPARYLEYIGESVQGSSYLKTPYFKALGLPGGMYRVGPLARLNICERMGVPRADAELGAFKQMGRGAVTSSFLYHYARLIEVLAAIEHVERALEDPDLSSSDLRADAGVNSLRGVGVSEAPRGTLFHDYTVDRSGLLRRSEPDCRHRPQQPRDEPNGRADRAPLRSGRGDPGAGSQPN
jgi:NAD-reducing hydrogenase large subunit